VLESHAKRADEHLVLEDLRRATKVVARRALPENPRHAGAAPCSHGSRGYIGVMPYRHGQALVAAPASATLVHRSTVLAFQLFV
jgi:hypothetical protein